MIPSFRPAGVTFGNGERDDTRAGLRHLLDDHCGAQGHGPDLDIHPLVVLIVTALGGLLGGIVGLILAGPVTLIAANAIARLRSRGILQRAAERARPAVQHMLD